MSVDKEVQNRKNSLYLTFKLDVFVLFYYPYFASNFVWFIIPKENFQKYMGQNFIKPFCEM